MVFICRFVLWKSGRADNFSWGRIDLNESFEDNCAIDFKFLRFLSEKMKFSWKEAKKLEKDLLKIKFLSLLITSKEELLWKSSKNIKIYEISALFNRFLSKSWLLRHFKFKWPPKNIKTSDKIDFKVSQKFNFLRKSLFKKNPDYRRIMKSRLNVSLNWIKSPIFHSFLIPKSFSYLILSVIHPFSI